MGALTPAPKRPLAPTGTQDLLPIRHFCHNGLAFGREQDVTLLVNHPVAHAVDALVVKELPRCQFTQALLLLVGQLAIGLEILVVERRA